MCQTHTHTPGLLMKRGSRRRGASCKKVEVQRCFLSFSTGVFSFYHFYKEILEKQNLPLSPSRQSRLKISISYPLLLPQPPRQQARPCQGKVNTLPYLAINVLNHKPNFYHSLASKQQLSTPLRIITLIIFYLHTIYSSSYSRLFYIFWYDLLKCSPCPRLRYIHYILSFIIHL